MRMKKILPFFLVIFFHVQVIAQVSIPNGGFENWITGNNLHPRGFSNNSNRENFFRSNLPFNLTRTADSWHGSYAVMLQTLISGKDTAGGYMVDSPNTDGNNWHGGVPYTEMPTGFRGYYKCNIAVGDSGLILAAFSKGGINIGMYFYKIGGIKTDYTLFNFPLIPALTQTPDSVMVGFTSSDLVNNIIKGGSTITVDSVSFTGVTSQPSTLYGDFEIWVLKPPIPLPGAMLSNFQHMLEMKTIPLLQGVAESRRGIILIHVIVCLEVIHIHSERTLLYFIISIRLFYLTTVLQ